MWLNILWPFVPAAIAVHFAIPDHHKVIFAICYIAMVPCANMYCAPQSFCKPQLMFFQAWSGWSRTCSKVASCCWHSDRNHSWFCRRNHPLHGPRRSRCRSTKLHCSLESSHPGIYHDQPTLLSWILLHCGRNCQ